MGQIYKAFTIKDYNYYAPPRTFKVNFFKTRKSAGYFYNNLCALQWTPSARFSFTYRGECVKVIKSVQLHILTVYYAQHVCTKYRISIPCIKELLHKQPDIIKRNNKIWFSSDALNFPGVGGFLFFLSSWKRFSYPLSQILNIHFT